MSNMLDPGKDARRAQRRAAEEAKKMKQKQMLEKAEAEDVAAKKKALAFDSGKGRRSLIQGMRDTLG